MNKELPSRTSIWAAAARAVGVRAGNPDTLAPKIIGPEEIALLGDHPLADALRGGDRSHPEVLSALFTLMVRTRFIDESLTRAIANGATQVVIMGAGFDTRAHRLSSVLEHTRVFEVDRPQTQEWKRRRILEAVGPPPANLTYAPIDFRHQSLEEVLTSAGYDRSQRTHFIWEGVTFYLPEDAVRATLTWVAAQAPGGTLVFDFVYRRLIEYMATARREAESGAQQMLADRLRQIASWGEPWIFGIPDEAAPAFLASTGLTSREILSISSPEALRRYTDWNATAQQPAIRPFYCVAEAAVTAPN